MNEPNMMGGPIKLILKRITTSKRFKISKPLKQKKTPSLNVPSIANPGQCICLIFKMRPTQSGGSIKNFDNINNINHCPSDNQKQLIVT